MTPMVGWFTFLIMLVLVPVQVSALSEPPVEETDWGLIEQRATGAYALKLFERQTVYGPWRRLDVERDDRVLWSVEDASIYIDASHASEKRPDREFDADLTGDGIRDLAIEAYSGGNHCCARYFLFSMEDSLRDIGQIETKGAAIVFRNLDQVPDLEGISYDTSFEGWNASMVGSPWIRIVFKYLDGRYRLAPDLMRRPQIPDDDLAALAEQVKVSEDWLHAPGYESRLWAVMLDLIYSGHYPRAERFLNEAWPSREGKEEFRFEFFECQLRRSPYWPEIAPLNGLPASPPRADCPKR
jgi:hypothetical protein